MQKKKSETKLNFPTVGICKTNQTFKNYISKSKSKEFEDKNQYYQMPSIHCNQHSMKTFLQNEQKYLVKLQMKILKILQKYGNQKNKEQWQVYIKKSQLVNARNTQFSQIEQFLLKNIIKLSQKINQTYNGLDNSQNINSLNEANTSVQKKTIYQIDKTIKSSIIQIKTNQKIKIQDKSSLQLATSKNKINKTKIQDLQNSQSTFQYQKAILQKKIQLYQSRIEQMQQTMKKYQVKQKISQGQQIMNDELMQAITLKNKYKYDASLKAMQNESLNKQINIIKQQLFLTNNKIKQLENDIKKKQQQNLKFSQYLKYRQLWIMASQQINMRQIIRKQDQEQKQNLNTKIKGLKQKNKQLLNYFNMSSMMNPDQQQDKTDLDKVIKQFKNWLNIISVPKGKQQQTIVTQNQNQIVQELGIKLMKPNFYVFFQSYEQTLITQKNLLSLKPVQFGFFGKLNLILDGLYNAYISAHSYKDYPQFPQFTMGFIQKIYFNSVNLCLQQRKKNLQNQQKVTFIINLFNKNFCNTSLCQVFRQFLLQKYYPDEIFFFLQCRNQINSLQPSNYKLGASDSVQYVKLSIANKLISKKLISYQNFIIQKIKNILKSKKKVKYGQPFIDKYFVLKILLEVYALQKAKSIKIFQNSLKSNSSNNLAYSQFSYFMSNNFPFVSVTDVGYLYRYAYTLSSKLPGPKALYHVCAQKGLFIQLRKLKCYKNEIQVKLKNESINDDMLILDIQNSIAKIRPHSQQLGLQNYINIENTINNFLSSIPELKQKRVDFFTRIMNSKIDIIKINTLLQLKGADITQQITQKQIQSQLIQFHWIIRQIQTKIISLNRQKEKRKRSLNLIVKKFKERVLQSMQQFQKMDQQQMKKIREQLKQTKKDQNKKQ